VREGEDVPVTRSDGLSRLFDLRVLRQTRASAIPVDLLPDLLEVTEEHGRILDVAVRAIPISFVACHTSLPVEVLAFQRGLDLAPHDVDAALVGIGGGANLSAESRGFGTDFGADGLVEECVARGGDFGREGGVGELGGKLGGDLELGKEGGSLMRRCVGVGRGRGRLTCIGTEL